MEKDKDYFLKLRKKYDDLISESNKFYTKVNKISLNKINDVKLHELLCKMVDCIDKSVGIGHTIEPYVLTFDKKIKNELGKYIKDEKQLNLAFSILTAPIKESFINRYENELRRIKSTDEGKREKMLKGLISKFFWIRNGYSGSHELTKEELTEDMNSLKESQKIDIKLEKREITRKYDLPEKILRKTGYLEFLGEWQDERKENILISMHYMDKLLFELSNRISTKVKYLRYMIPDELIAGKYKEKEFIDKLKERRNGCIYLFDLSDSVIISGKEYQNFIKVFYKTSENDTKLINGMPASGGNAIGKARVCLNKSSIDKFSSGDILVASMTRPEYLPAMRKAAAIVTDEGGITCHAAIVSRELKIPCVIGTKIATKVIKDGDTIEVKGNHGQIKIIERAK